MYIGQREEGQPHNAMSATTYCREVLHLFCKNCITSANKVLLHLDCHIAVKPNDGVKLRARGQATLKEAHVVQNQMLRP